jgi:hypothetical protein
MPKKSFVVPVLRVESSLAVLTLTAPACSSRCEE